jgi:hypothetical protein
MKDSDRQVLGFVVMCGMLIGALLATWPRDTPAAPPSSVQECAAEAEPAATAAEAWDIRLESSYCRDQHSP